MPLLQGCLTFLAGGAALGTAGTVVYVRGNYSAELPRSLFACDRAVKTICRRARLTEIKRTCNGHRSVRICRDLQDVKIKIFLKELDPELTRITLRVGAWGDEESSRELLAEIERELGMPVSLDLDAP